MLCLLTLVLTWRLHCMEFASCHWPNLNCFCFEIMERNQGPYTKLSDGNYQCSECEKVIGNTLKGIKIHITKIHEKEPGTQKKQKKTSWANARVKLHSQVHFQSKKILGPKKFLFQKYFRSKKFWIQKF